jgi:hypothetical protein
MKIKLLLPVMAGSLLVFASAAFGASPAGMDDGPAGMSNGQAINKMQMAALQQQADEASRPQGGKPSKTGLVLMPQYYYTHNASKTMNVSDGMGGKMKVGGGHASGAGITAIATKEINKTFALSLIYSFVDMEYKGGAMHPNSVPGLDVKDRLNVISNTVGVSAGIDLDRAGRFTFTVTQSFDEFQGSRRTYINGVQLPGKTSMDNFSDRLTSLLGWYEIDVPLTESVILTPFIGWRSMYAHVDNTMGDDPDSSSAYAWTHLVGGGLKAGWHKDFLGLHVSGAINYRASHDDVSSFGTRATEPNVFLAGYNTTLDRTAVAFGAGASYVIPGFGVVLADWNGLFSANANAQMVSLGLVIPF